MSDRQDKMEGLVAGLEALVSQDRLEAQAIDHDAVLARLLAGEEPALAQVIVFPGWVEDGELLEHAASTAMDSRMELEVHLGGEPQWIQLSCRREFESADGGHISLRWHVDVWHTPGWELLVYRGGRRTDPVVVPLGVEPGGEVILTQEELGFDPVREVLAFGVRARD